MKKLLIIIISLIAIIYGLSTANAKKLIKFNPDCSSKYYKGSMGKEFANIFYEVLKLVLPDLKPKDINIYNGFFETQKGTRDTMFFVLFKYDYKQGNGERIYFICPTGFLFNERNSTERQMKRELYKKNPIEGVIKVKFANKSTDGDSSLVISGAFSQSNELNSKDFCTTYDWLISKMNNTLSELETIGILRKSHQTIKKNDKTSVGF